MGGFGTIAIDAKEVTVPTDETIHAFKVELTRSDLKHCQIIVDTTERTVNIAPDSDVYEELWLAADAMLRTPEGKAFLACLKVGVEEKPLKLSLTKEIAEVAAPMEL